MNKILENDVSFPKSTLPENITQLFRTAAVQNVNEAVAVLFHAYLLESGFLTKDVPDEDKDHYMPKDWNANGVFKINYMHKCCPEFACSVSFVFLYNNVSVHGIVCETACPDSVHMKMNFKKYIKQKTDFSSANVVFCNLEELCILFKDNFSLPFLNLLHEIGGRPLFGMPGLYDELKMYILRLLSVEYVLKMSAVNKNFNDLANSSSLWKHLCLRDFPKDCVPDIDTPSASSSSSSENNWKEVYKKEFLKKKRKRESFTRLPRHLLPPFFDISPDISPDTDFDIPFPFFDPPYLQPKIPPFLRRFL